MDRDDWDRRYQTGDYTSRQYPSELLTEHVSWLPSGRAIEVATGAGRNARYLAKHGYEVTALDISKVALSIAERQTPDLPGEIGWVHADSHEYSFANEAYDVAIVSYFHDPSLIPKLIDALVPGGVLLYEHHVQSATPVERGPDDDHRYRSNELLRSCLELTILQYSEDQYTFEQGERKGTTAAIATIMGQKTTTTAHSVLPERGRR